MLAGDLPGDVAVLRAVRYPEHGALREAALAVDAATDTRLLAVAAAVLVAALAVTGRRRTAALAGVSVGAALALGPAVKALVARPRPTLMTVPADTVSQHSFPSGHAVGTAVLASALLLVLPRRLGVPLALVVVAAPAAAQLVLAHHHPSDLVAGWALGAACAATVWACADGRRARQGSNLRPSA